MFGLIDQINELLPGYMLTFIRISTMVMVLPIISYPFVSARLRVLLAASLALIIFPLISTSVPELNSIPELLLVISREIMIGLIIGFGAKLIFEAFNMTGSFIGRQMGIGIANVMDPTSRQQIPVISQFWALLMTAFFLAVDGHHMLIGVIYKNFSYIPLGGGEFTPALGETIIRGGSQAYTIALRLGISAMVFLLLVDTAIAFVARVMPQMNIFLVTLPLKIGTGIFVLIASVDIFQLIFDSVYSDLALYLETIIVNLQSVS